MIMHAVAKTEARNIANEEKRNAAGSVQVTTAATSERARGYGRPGGVSGGPRGPGLSGVPGSLGGPRPGASSGRPAFSRFPRACSAVSWPNSRPRSRASSAASSARAFSFSLSSAGGCASSSGSARGGVGRAAAGGNSIRRVMSSGPTAFSGNSRIVTSRLLSPLSCAYAATAHAMASDAQIARATNPLSTFAITAIGSPARKLHVRAAIPFHSRGSTRSRRSNIQHEGSTLLAVRDLDEHLTAARVDRHDRQRQLIDTTVEVSRPTQLALARIARELDGTAKLDVHFGVGERLGRLERHGDVAALVQRYPHLRHCIRRFASGSEEPEAGGQCRDGRCHGGAAGHPGPKTSAVTLHGTRRQRSVDGTLNHRVADRLCRFVAQRTQRVDRPQRSLAVPAICDMIHCCPQVRAGLRAYGAHGLDGIFASHLKNLADLQSVKSRLDRAATTGRGGLGLGAAVT